MEKVVLVYNETVFKFFRRISVVLGWSWVLLSALGLLLLPLGWSWGDLEWSWAGLGCSWAWFVQ